MVSIDLTRGLIRAGDSLFDFPAEDLQAVESGLTLTLLGERDDEDDYRAEIDLSEGVIHAEATHDLPAGGYEIGSVDAEAIRLVEFDGGPAAA